MDSDRVSAEVEKIFDEWYPTLSATEGGFAVNTRPSRTAYSK